MLLKDIHNASVILEQVNERALQAYANNLTNFSSDDLTDDLVRYGIFDHSEWDEINDDMPNSQKAEELVLFMRKNPDKLQLWAEANL